MTGLTRDGNLHSKDLAWMEAHPKEAALRYRTTPTGNYFAQPNPDIYGSAGFNLNPISAFGESAPEAKNTAIHVIYPKDYKRRMKIMAGPGEKRIGSYGCTNMYGQDVNCLTGQLFPKGDTTMIVDTRIPKDNRFIQSFQRELGGTAIHPAMRTNFKQGGYYGMDGKLHKAKGSGTYVMNGGYYFQPGGTSTAPSATGSPIDDYSTSTGAPIVYDNMPNEDGTIDIDPNEQYNFEDTPEEQDADFGSDGMGNTRQQRRRIRKNTQYETDNLGGLYDSPMNEEQPMMQPYDPSQYSSAVNPATGFTTWSKGNQKLTNIKKQDPALWGQLKEEGNGARWRTGQTDFQKFGRGVDKVADAGQSLINTAGAFGQFLNSRQELKNANTAIINQNSTASQNTNPQAAGKGTGPGQTGSSYGMMDPTSVGARSFKGMYGKYGMEVPKFQPGGGFSNLFPSAQSVVPISSPINLIPNMSFSQLAAPIVDNTRTTTQKINFEPEAVSETETVSKSDDNLKNLISQKESGGNYKALPWNKTRTKLASSAVGKYQFLWKAHKNSIEKVTGVKTKEEFRNNPNAQEEFFDYWDKTTLTPFANKIKSQLKTNVPINKIKAAIHFSGPGGAMDYFLKGKLTKDNFGSTTSSYIASFKKGGQFGGQVMEMEEEDIKQFLKAGGQLEFLD
jgi:hypothetical protein